MNVDPAEHHVLAQPTRARLFGLLTELHHPASTDDLAAKLGRHPNGVRLHLERLREAGLVVSEKQTGGRGRPRVLWSVDPAASPGGERPTAYAHLSTWLTEAIADGLRRPEEIESRGREIGVGLAGEDAGDSDPPTRLHRALAALGFQPTLDRGGAGRVTYCLGNCPYRNAAKESRSVVCGLHRGITDGLLSAMDPEARLTAFVPKDPDLAGCLVDVRFDPAEAGG